MSNQYSKSCIRSYNNNAQAFTAAVTPLVIEGTPVVESGCSLRLNSASVRVLKSGLYHISADVTFIPSAAGIAVLQFYKDGVALPCAIASETVVAGDTYTRHIETDLEIIACCVNHPLITLAISGVAGSVTHSCVGVLKLA